MTWAADHLVLLDHWDDLISDFSVLHHVHTPLERLPACWLWPMAERLAAYTGVMRARAETAQEGTGAQQSAAHRSRSSSATTARQDNQGRHVNPVRDFRPDDPLLKGYVETSHHKPPAKKGA